MKKKIYLTLLTVIMACSLFGCGKKKEEGITTTEDPKAAVREDIFEFVNQELPSIKADRDNAISIYNSYFQTENVDLEQFLAELDSKAIPGMNDYMAKLQAIEVSSNEVSNIKAIYVQSSQKQLDAMNMVASAIREQNPEYLSQADLLIKESKDLLASFESELKVLAANYDITVNGTFTSNTAAEAPTEASTEAVDEPVSEVQE